MKQEIIPLTTLRGLAALWIVVKHYSIGEPNDYLPSFSNKVNFGHFTYFIDYASYAVDIFFLLSGFILFYIYGERLSKISNEGYVRNIYNFFVARFARVWPATAFFSTFLFMLYLSGFWLPDKEVNWEIYLSNLAFLDLAYTYPLNINGPAWTLSAEFFAYLLCPVFFLLLCKIKNIKLLFASILFLSGIYCFTYEAICEECRITSNFLLFRCALQVFMGCLLCLIYKNIAKIDQADTIFVCLFIAFIILMSFFPLVYFIHPLLPLLVLFLALSHKRVYEFFSMKPLHYLGKISLSIYLIHYPILEFMQYSFADHFAALDRDKEQFILVLYLLLMVTGTVILSSITYHLTEVPSRKFIREKFFIK